MLHNKSPNNMFSESMFDTSSTQNLSSDYEETEAAETSRNNDDKLKQYGICYKKGHNARTCSENYENYKELSLNSSEKILKETRI
ncbi:15989_t:CDS:2, partial [Gigaspora rosea]